MPFLTVVCCWVLSVSIVIGEHILCGSRLFLFLEAVLAAQITVLAMLCGPVWIFCRHLRTCVACCLLGCSAHQLMLAGSDECSVLTELSRAFISCQQWVFTSPTVIVGSVLPVALSICFVLLPWLKSTCFGQETRSLPQTPTRSFILTLWSWYVIFHLFIFPLPWKNICFFSQDFFSFP